MKTKMNFPATCLHKSILVVILGLACFSCTRPGVKEDPIVTSVADEMDQSNNIRQYLMSEAGKITGNSLSDINSLADWEADRSKRYDELVEMLGLNNVPLEGEKPDLNVKVTGIIQLDGYRIEKLYYESLPSLYVPANLYIPDSIKDPCPAILYLCGHASTQKVYYQAFGHKFARLGFVCLIIETIQYGEVKGEHHGCYDRGWFNWYSRGYTPAGVEVWNAIRGIDLLCSRKEVDPDRIGVNGRSGGGAQTYFVSAVDKRVKAAAAEAGATTLSEQILTRSIDGHCDCMVPINTCLYDMQDIGSLIAPRPLLIVQGKRDNLFSIEGTRKLFGDIGKIYGYYNASDKVQLLETEGGHNSNNVSRQGVFAFFLEHLTDIEISPETISDIDESETTMLTEEELKVYVNGIPPDDRTTTIQNSFIKLPAAPVITSEKELSIFHDEVMNFLKTRTFGAFPANNAPFNTHLLYRSADLDKFGNNIYSFVTEEGWRLKIDIRWRNDPSNVKPLMIILGNSGEEFAGAEEFINGLADDWNIAYFNTRGAGETGWDPGLQWHIRRASAWTGRTIASMQVYDVIRCMEFCRSLNNISADSIGIAAKNEMGVVALYAALLDGNCHTVMLKNPTATQDMVSWPDGHGQAIEMLNCLRMTDVCQIPALIPSTDIIFTGDVPDSYLWAEDIRIRLWGKVYDRREADKPE
jgi:cephalosporin-C deacetylase-like acetyl esterase